MTAVPPLAVGVSTPQIVVASSMFTSLDRTSIVTAFPWYVVAESVACNNCCKFAVALYPDSAQSSKDKCLLPVIQSSLIFIVMETATLRRD